MLTLRERAEQLTTETQEVAKLSMFNQPAAIKKMLPDITGLIGSLCGEVDALRCGMKKQQLIINALAEKIAEQQRQIVRITGGG